MKKYSKIKDIFFNRVIKEKIQVYNMQNIPCEIIDLLTQPIEK